MLHKEIELDFSVREKVGKYLDYPGEPEMTLNESAFLTSMIKKQKPKKILELGVAAGGTTTIILEALIQINTNFKMFSVDLNANFYRNKSLKTGFLANKFIDENDISVHQFIFNKTIPEIIESIGSGIDLVVLDTTHSLPGELLDFIIVYPFLSENAMVLLHDTGLNIIKNNNSYATKLLFDLVIAEKYQLYDDTYIFPNISGFIVNSETKKNVINLFSALTLNWNYNLNEHTDHYHKMIKKYYNDMLANYFLKINNSQKALNKQIYTSPKNKLFSILFVSLKLINDSGFLFFLKTILRRLSRTKRNI